MHLRFLETVPMSTDNVRTLLGYGERMVRPVRWGPRNPTCLVLAVRSLVHPLGGFLLSANSPITVVGTLPGLLVLLSPAEKSGGKGERVKVRGLLVLEGAGGLQDRAVKRKVCAYQILQYVRRLWDARRGRLLAPSSHGPSAKQAEPYVYEKWSQQ